VGVDGGAGSLILNQDALPAGLAPHSGNYAVWMGGAYDEESTLSQSVVLSSSIESLVYHYWIGSQDLCGYDRVEIRINGSAVKTHNLCMDENTNGWQQGALDLKSFAGKTVDLAFYLTVDSSYNSNFLLDTIYLAKRAGGTVTPTTTVTTTATPEPAAFVLKANPGSKNIVLAWTVPNHPSVVDYRVLRGTEQSFTAITNGSGNLGGQATVTLQATDLLRFAAGDFVVLYDPAIASVRSVARAGIAEAGNFTLSSHEQTPGRLRIVLAGNQALNGNGALALVTFDLKPKAPVGNSTLRLAEAALYDLHGRHFVRNFSNNVVERRNGLLTLIGQTINQIYLPLLSR
jgi:hypothetical protein